jgi:hypothetical protein
MLILTSCTQIDKQIKVRLDRILESDEFQLITFRASCLPPVEMSITKSKLGTLLLIPYKDSTKSVEEKFTEDKKTQVRNLIITGYNTDKANDTGPGNLNRYYILCSGKVTIHFMNNKYTLLRDFLEINKSINSNLKDSLMEVSK